MADYSNRDNPSSQADPDSPLNFSLAPLSPARQTLSPFKGSGQFHLLILNHRDKLFQVQLSGFDHTGQCQVEFPAPNQADQSAQFRLPPGRTVIPVRVSPPPRPLFGVGKQVYHITLMARPAGGGQAARLSRGHLHTLPLLGPTALTLLALCLFIISGLLFIIQPTHEPQTSPAAGSIEFVTVTPPPPAVAAPVEPPNEPPPAAESHPRPTIPYEQIFREVATEYDLDWQLLAMQAYSESRFDPHAIGVHNDMGLMQIIPSTWNEWSPQVGVSDPFDPYSNVRVGAAYLAFLRDYFAELGYYDDYWMLVAYNWGPYNLELFLQNNGGWAEVPLISRTYALNILQANPQATFGWTDLEAALAVRTASQQ